MTARIIRTDPPGERRFPVYATATLACKVGCFECGAQLVEIMVRPTGRRHGHGAMAVRCASCDALKEFDLTPTRKVAR